MTENPLRSLLRGCKGSSVAKWKTSAAAKPAPLSLSAPHTLARELDFFGTAAVIPSSSPTPAQPSATTAAADGEPFSTTAATRAERSALSAAVDDATLEEALLQMGIRAPTPVQRRTMPAIRAGRDVVAVAPTGSGKTLAYVLPILRALRVEATRARRAAPYAVVLAPTRELAEQIGRVVTRVSSAARLGVRLKVVCSKAAAAGLKGGGGVDLVVATPMRLVTAVESGGLDVGVVRHVVLDEADELFDDKFVGQIDGVLGACGREVEEGARVHMFSATLPPRVEQLAKSVQREARKVVVDAGVYGGAAAVGGVGATIRQRFIFVGGRGEQGKVMAVRDLLRNGLKAPALLFVQSKERAAELFRELVYDGVRVEAMHADRSQAARASAVARFRSGEVWVLIATDVLARGLDFLCVNSVINYDVPASATAYVHRIGRTGRNGRNGEAVTLFTEDDGRMMGEICRVAKASGADVPGWIGTGRKDEVRRLEKRPVARGRIGGPNRAALRKRDRKEKAIGAKRDGVAAEGGVQKRRKGRVKGKGKGKGAGGGELKEGRKGEVDLYDDAEAM